MKSVDNVTEIERKGNIIYYMCICWTGDFSNKLIHSRTRSIHPLKSNDISVAERQPIVYFRYFTAITRLDAERQMYAVVRLR